SRAQIPPTREWFFVPTNLKQAKKRETRPQRLWTLIVEEQPPTASSLAAIQPLAEAHASSGASPRRVLLRLGRPHSDQRPLGGRLEEEVGQTASRPSQRPFCLPGDGVGSPPS